MLSFPAAKAKWQTRLTHGIEKKHQSFHCDAAEMNLIAMRIQVRPLASISGLRIQHCLELWCRSQTWFRSFIAVAVI